MEAPRVKPPVASSTLDMLRRLAAERPADADVRVHLAELLMAQQMHDEAGRWLDEALRAEPGNVSALRLQASLLFAQGADAKARALLDKAAASGTVDAASSLLLARVLLRLGDRARAEEAYFQAVQVDESAADAGLLEEIQGKAEALAHEVGSSGTADAFTSEKTGISFDDVGGMEQVKEHLRMNIVLPLQKPDIFRAYGKRIGGGILMYGPPGCGKSYLARALAGECHARFYMVGLHDILDKWIGQSERNMHELFEQARRTAPSIIFLDEIDVVGGKRGEAGAAALRGTVNQLLQEMDKVGDPTKPVLVVGATNVPWLVDNALKRPGRFDRVVFVPPPDVEAREAILRLHLRGKPTEEIDVRKVAAKTDGFSGADLRAVVDRAVEAALGRALKSGNHERISTVGLLDAVKTTQASTGEWLASARDYAKYSNQSGLYDPVRDYFDGKR